MNNIDRAANDVKDWVGKIEGDLERADHNINEVARRIDTERKRVDAQSEIISRTEEKMHEINARIWSAISEGATSLVGRIGSIESRLDALEKMHIPEPEPEPEPEPDHDYSQPLGAGRVFYVSPSGNNSDGASWATAWRTLDLRNRPLRPGDLVMIDGGAEGIAYTNGLDIRVGGTKELPIRIAVSREPGHDGVVTINCLNSAAQLRIWAPYITLDGDDRLFIPCSRRDGNPVFYIGYTGFDATGAIVRNLEMFGPNTDPSWFGPMLNVYSNGFLLYRVKFTGNSGEDHLTVLVPVGVIQECVFSGQFASGTIVHRDVISVQPYSVSQDPQRGLEILNNLFLNNDSDNIIFLSGGVPYGNIWVRGNRFVNCNTALKLDPRLPVNAGTNIQVISNVRENVRTWFAGFNAQAWVTHVDNTEAA